MNSIYTIFLLTISNTFMTIAWYGHLKYAHLSIFQKYGLFSLIIVSWLIAFVEYCFMIPANKYGFIENGGTFNLWQLKVLQEIITLVVFTVFATLFFKNESLKWNHLAAFLCLIMAVYFVFKK